MTRSDIEKDCGPCRSLFFIGFNLIDGVVKLKGTDLSIFLTVSVREKLNNTVAEHFNYTNNNVSPD